MNAEEAIPGIDTASPTNSLSAQVTSKMSLSTSPSAAFPSSLASRDGPRWHRGGATVSAAKQLKPFATEDIKILLLENVNQTGRDVLEAQGYQVDFLKTSLPEDELIQRIRYSTSRHWQVTSTSALTAGPEMFMLSVYDRKPSSRLECYERLRILSLLDASVSVPTRWTLSMLRNTG